MKVTPHPAIATINAKIEEFKALEADFKNDKTLELAQSALDSAKAAAEAAEAEDDDTDPEQLVDLRLEARRQVEIAEIRLGRAQKAMESREEDLRWILIEAGKVAAEALSGAVEPFGNRLEAELRELIGDEDYNVQALHFKTLIYRKQERLNAHSRQMNRSVSIPGLVLAIGLLEDAGRLG